MPYNYRQHQVQMYPPPYPPTDLTPTPCLEDALQLPATPGADVPATSVQRSDPDREYLGMLEYKDADEHLLIKCLITG